MYVPRPLQKAPDTMHQTNRQTCVYNREKSPGRSKIISFCTCREKFKSKLNIRRQL